MLVTMFLAQVAGKVAQVIMISAQVRKDVGASDQKFGAGHHVFGAGDRKSGAGHHVFGAGPHESGTGHHDFGAGAEKRLLPAPQQKHKRLITNYLL